MEPLTFSECLCSHSTNTKDIRNLLYTERMAFNLLSKRIDICLDRVFSYCTLRNDRSILDFRLNAETYLNLKRAANALKEQKRIIENNDEYLKSNARCPCIACETEIIDMFFYQSLKFKHFFNTVNKRRFLDLLNPYFIKFGKQCTRFECPHCLIVSIDNRWYDEEVLVDFVIYEADAD